MHFSCQIDCSKLERAHREPKESEVERILTRVAWPTESALYLASNDRRHEAFQLPYLIRRQDSWRYGVSI